jgi:signal transduction histidine kinase
MRPCLPATLQRRVRPPLIMGILVAALCLVVETTAGVLLKRVVPIQSLSVLYLIGLLLIASVWGLVPGLVMAVASTVLFDYFLVPPARTLRLTREGDLAILGVFLAIALLACALARLSQRLSAETEAREEADLSAELARLLVRTPDPTTVLQPAARRLARTLGLPSATIEPGVIASDTRHEALPLRGDDVPATLLVPLGLPRPVIRRLRERVVPSLEVLLEAACERKRVADALRDSHDELARIADEQASLRRLATLVAHAAPPTEVFQAVAREMGRLLGAMHTVVARYEPVATTVTVGSWNDRPDLDATMPLHSHWTLEPGTVSELVARTGAPARVNAYTGDGPLARRLRARGIVSSVGCPIVVGRSLWGVAIVSASTPEPLPDDTETRMLEFTELAAAAIANAQGNADLKASRSRVIAAADEARRRIERDLHDGTQQRLVSLSLELRGIGEAIPPELDEVRTQLTRTARSLDDAVVDLQELSRGLHPAILARGGLKPALRALARRSAMPVDLDVSVSGRFPQRVEVTVYYVVSEALTNAAKHAFASLVRVGLAANGGTLRLTISDDGVGGADPKCGSGLIGLADRVEAIGGKISIVSPARGGTSLRIELPLDERE